MGSRSTSSRKARRPENRLRRRRPAGNGAAFALRFLGAGSRLHRISASRFKFARMAFKAFANSAALFWGVCAEFRDIRLAVRSNSLPGLFPGFGGGCAFGRKLRCVFLHAWPQLSVAGFKARTELLAVALAGF